MIKKLLLDKALGFYFAAAAGLVALVTALVYLGGYVNTALMNSSVFVFALLAFVFMAAHVALCFIKPAVWRTIAQHILPAIATLFGLFALLTFAYSIYNYVSEVMYGIDKHSFDPEFIASVVLLVLSLVLSNACVYLKPFRKSAEKE